MSCVSRIADKLFIRELARIDTDKLKGKRHREIENAIVKGSKWDFDYCAVCLVSLSGSIKE